MKSSPLPRSAVSADGRPALDGRMKRNTERAFLKLLMAQDANEESHRLQCSLERTERDEKCIRRGVFLMVMLFLLSVAGLSYCAILMPEVLDDSGYHILQCLGGLGAGSLISLLAFLGYFIWKRAMTSRLYKVCRVRALAMVKAQFKTAATPNLAVDLSGVSHSGPGGLPVQPAGMPQDGRAG